MSEEIVAVPLLAPAGGTPEVIDNESGLVKAIEQLTLGTGPFAVDAERASGFRYSARAYLIQIKRNGGGLHLIDPIPFGINHPLILKLNDLLNTDEVILHASTQDLPCLREIGINPSLLFDTELAGRIAGLPRVGLGPLLESLMGVSLAKEHSAADWSVRPLPTNWLTYAALDVELLVELRDRIYQILTESKKLPWAMEEFASILLAPPSPPRIDPWRRTSGMHKIKRRDQLAIVRSLWIARDKIASQSDIAQGKLLNDNAIVELAIAAPTTKKEFEKALRPLGLRARWLENLPLWLESIATAVALPEQEWPQMRTNADTLPPIKLWRDKFPDKYAPLTHARMSLEKISEENSIPVENLITPELVRRICWNPPQGSTELLQVEAVEQSLLTLGARPWQVNLVGRALAEALLEKEPVPVIVDEDTEANSTPGDAKEEAPTQES
ncbi:MAG: HRDC domain-containing protein [Streptomycetaceae bacterium]|jgi:ribonuclease D|nr:HRDC domain-containing protein [Streptomycetaceae bacterium]